MIDFKPVTLADREWMNRHIFEENSRSCDFNFTNIYIWGDVFSLTAAEVSGRLAFQTVIDGKIYYSFPIGAGDMRAAVLELIKDAEERGLPFVLRGITPENSEKIDILFPCLFEFSEERRYFDYIYSAEKLATLSGKRLHAKRNHINRFENTYKWSFEPVTPSNLSLCAEMNTEWVRRTEGEESSESYRQELAALNMALNDFEYLELEGGILRADGEVVAFTLGEILSGDTYVIHFEKAFKEIDGAYPMINREFVRYVISKHPEIKYINREDDMGVENLRRAKESYCPEFLIEKYIATPRINGN